MKNYIHIGIDIDLQKLVDTRLLIQAGSGGGKSYALRKVIESVGDSVQQIILDPEGEFVTLREKFDFALAFGVPTLERHVWFISETNGERLERCGKESYQDSGRKKKFQGANPGILNRRNISESRFRHVGERLSRRLDKEGRKWLKAFGNAVPPQVAYQIFRAIEKAA